MRLSCQMPLSVCILDMQWHLVNVDNAKRWTGYTWNKELIPEPKALLEYIHDQNCKVSLNLHPADGCLAHEQAYEELAAFMGVDPATKRAIAFDCTDPKFLEGYFRLLHHPHEELGVDVWWNDWQQGEHCKLDGLKPQWILNHLHHADAERNTEKRPLIMARWGGLGGHRVPIGFSGDTVAHMRTLSFLPEFTATAANGT